MLGQFYWFDVNIKSKSDSVMFDHVNKSFAIHHGRFMDQIGELQLQCVSPRGAIFATENGRYVIATGSWWILESISGRFQNLIGTKWDRDGLEKK